MAELSYFALFFNGLWYNAHTMPGERQPHNHPESQPIRNRGGESIGTQPTGRPENPQLRTIQLNRIINKDELNLFQGAADAVTQAGLGTHRYTVTEKQISPYTGNRLEADSPLLAVTYRGQVDRDILLEVIIEAREAKWIAHQEGKPQQEIDQAVQNAITKAVNYQLRLEEIRRGSPEQGTVPPPETSYEHVDGMTLQDIKNAMEEIKRIKGRKNNLQQQ
jgi:hypothetical protein